MSFFVVVEKSRNAQFPVTVRAKFRCRVGVGQ